MPLSIDELLQRLENAPSSALAQKEVRSPEVFDAWIRRCLELSTSDPRPSVTHLENALAIATTKCQAVLCLALTAAAYRNLDEIEEAEANLTQAFRLGRGCDACKADLTRRRAYLHASRGHQEAALADADTAIRIYQELSSPDHDLWNNGLGDAFHTRGDIRSFFGVSGAIEDLSRALAMASPSLSPELYSHSLLNQGVALRALGGVENLLTADHYIREAWKYFKARKGRVSREHAHLCWQTAMVRLELRQYPEGKAKIRQRPAQLRDMLKRARNAFVKLGMPSQSAAVAADLARVLYPKRLEIIDLMDETADLIDARWRDFHPEIWQAFDPVWHAMVAVKQTVGDDVVLTSYKEQDHRIRAVIEQMRETCAEAAQGQLPACLLSWPSSE